MLLVLICLGLILWALRPSGRAILGVLIVALVVWAAVKAVPNSGSAPSPVAIGSSPPETEAERIDRSIGPGGTGQGSATGYYAADGTPILNPHGHGKVLVVPSHRQSR
jgi:hypothetical protein